MITVLNGSDDRDRVCAICGAPASVARTSTLFGAGFGAPGTDCIVTMGRIQCAAGHFYDAELGTDEFPPVEEDA